MKWLGILVILVLFWGCGHQKNVTESNASSSDPLDVYAWHLKAPAADFAATFAIDPDANVHLDDSWRTSRGKGVTVAVIDAYFDPEHPDLRDNVVLTHNVRNGTKDVSMPENINDPHGQLCAGTIAASQNAIGITGVAPKASLMLIGVSLDGPDSDIIKAFEFAKAHGADIVSCSWGSYAVSAAVADEIRSLYDANITVVFAAGNDDYDMDGTLPGTQTPIEDESELPWVIGVTASSEYNDRTSYANYGSAIDLMAPGGERIGIPSTDQSGSGGLSPDRTLSAQLLGDDYAFFSGTSAAAPIVAGAAALLKAIDPALTPEQIRAILINTADKIGGEGLYDENGFSQTRAYGKLNISRAVRQLFR